MPRLVDSFPRQLSAANVSLGPAMMFSIGFHLALGWLFLFGLPAFWSTQGAIKGGVIMVNISDGKTFSSSAAEEDGSEKSVATDKIAMDEKEPQVTEKATDSVAGTDASAEKSIVTEKIAADEKASRDAEKATEATTEDAIALGPVIKDEEQVRDSEKTAATTKAQNEEAASEAQYSALSEKLKEQLKIKEEEERIAAAIAGLSGQTGAGEGLGVGQTADGESVDPRIAAYYARIQEIIRSNWVTPPGVLASTLNAEVVIKIEPDGRISAFQVNRPSGDNDFDASIKLAVSRSKLPPLPEIFEGRAEVVGLSFNSGQMQRQAGEFAR